MTITFQEAYAAQREHLQTEVVRKKKTREPILATLWVILGTLAGTLTGKSLLWYSRLRRTVLYLGGFGFIDYAAWSWNPIVGYLCIGVTLLILDTLSGGNE